MKSPSTKIRKRVRLTVLSVMCAAAVFLSSCGGTPAPTPTGAASTSEPSGSSTPAVGDSLTTSDVPEGGIITFALMHSWTKLNLWDAEDDLAGNMVLDKIWDKLVYANNEDDIVEPRAAKSWDISGDKREWTFHLDERSKFSDGAPVTANDWVFTFQTISDPEVICVMKNYLSVLEGTDGSGAELSENSIGVSAKDDYTLVMKFKLPMFEDIFAYKYNSKYCVLPQHLLKDVPMSTFLTDSFWTKPIGSGPCKIREEVTGSSITLDVIKDYPLGNTNADTVVYKVVEYANYVPSLIAQEIDSEQGYISYDDATSGKTYDSFNIIQAKYPDVATLLFINNANVTDKRVRQAMNLAIDKQTYTDVAVKGFGVPSETYVIPGSKYFNDTLTYERNVDGAKALLADAGWDSNRVLKWATYGTDAGQLLIQQNFAEAGIKVEFVTLDIPSIFVGMING
ncbi:MAG: ABC transporter substrate-binding protein, partial [Oscillospiraceae bacterium]|nr:ABC transporter substrate-binding protein [Oscillospiraceae bacterium]